MAWFRSVAMDVLSAEILIGNMALALNGLRVNEYGCDDPSFKRLLGIVFIMCVVWLWHFFRVVIGILAGFVHFGCVCLGVGFFG